MVLLYFLFSILILTVGTASIRAEKSAYENMIRYPSNSTVLKYISAFQSYYKNFFAKYLQRMHISENRIRQAQGYLEIAANPDISEDVKEQLKTVLLLKGVPVEI